MIGNQFLYIYLPRSGFCFYPATAENPTNASGDAASTVAGQI